MRDVVVAGVGMTPFGKHPARTIRSLVEDAVASAIADAGMPSPGEAGLAAYSNVLSGVLQGQESTRGQHALRDTALRGVSVVNVENACASGATGLHLAWLAVASGQVEVAVAVGAEKLSVPDKARAAAALTTALDQDRLAELDAELGLSGPGSVFMEIYTRWAAGYLDSSDATLEDFARIAVKNHAHGAVNPWAQYGARMTVEEVLSARRVSELLTVPMCAPMSDGAAAVVVTTPAVAARWDADSVRLRATVVGTGRPGAYGELVPEVARRAYEMASVGPEEVDVVECHDAAAPAELIVMEELGLCKQGEAVGLLRAGETGVAGRLPVNPSGGLESRGHPLGATGLAQVVELTDQLRGRAGARQVEGARIGVAENAGGYFGPDAAVAAVTVLSTL